MSQLEPRLVDPRDARWELWDPTYRVYFWRRAGGGWASRELELSAPDVVSVLRWAPEHAGDDETYQVFAVAMCDGKLGIVRLAGDDPTRGDRS